MHLKYLGRLVFSVLILPGIIALEVFNLPCWGGRLCSGGVAAEAVTDSAVQSSHFMVFPLYFPEIWKAYKSEMRWSALAYIVNHTTEILGTQGWKLGT